MSAGAPGSGGNNDRPSTCPPSAACFPLVLKQANHGRICGACRATAAGRSFSARTLWVARLSASGRRIPSWTAAFRPRRSAGRTIQTPASWNASSAAQHMSQAEERRQVTVPAHDTIHQSAARLHNLTRQPSKLTSTINPRPHCSTGRERLHVAARTVVGIRWKHVVLPR